MSVLDYPSIKKYKLPEKNVLVLSCIDLRLADDLLRFLNHDNLANRYDHFALAGTSLCTCTTGHHREQFKPEVLEAYDDFKAWRSALNDHLQIAIALHDIRDVYIVEHRNCGAYKEFLKKGKYKTEAEELDDHAAFAKTLADEIHETEYHTPGNAGETHKLHVHCFLIDLRGNIELLHTTNKPY